jgi:1-deoxy-D-xylulose-5-phosphate synthase
LYKYNYLNEINSPEDLRIIPQDKLQNVCDEVREFMIDTITKTGGHFGAGLGVVELTVALHYIYNTPLDKIIFDTGHQGYPHKILTGRRDQLHTIRKKGGLSGFLKRSESEYDVFGAGHASTSISSALGVATARDLNKKDYRVIAIIGDGAMTGGLAFEAMNNCGVQKRDVTVVLNDNNVSIDPNVSALSNYFNDLYATTAVQRIRENIWELTGKMDLLGDRLRTIASKIEGSVKAIITPGILFEAMGFNYFGPVNGHNIQRLVRILRQIKDVHGPILLHIISNKGKGYAPAESDAHHLHAIGKIDRNTGKSLKKLMDGTDSLPYYKVFGKAMVELCRMNPKIVGVTAAMSEGTGLDELEHENPERFFDVGIAEGHAVTFSAGMAVEGIIPVVAIYSTFLQRAIDNIAHDCALQNLHVVFAIDRAGLVGEDGPTHHGTMDIPFLRTIPNMTVLAPKDEQELRDLLYSAVFSYTQGPVSIRFPRGKGPGVAKEPMKLIPYASWEILRDGEDIAILATGKMVHQAELACHILEEQGISARLINARFIKPLDTNILNETLENFHKIITIEEGQILGGFGSSVLEYAESQKSNRENEIYIHGIPDKYIEHGTQQELLHMLKLDSTGIASLIKELLNKPHFINNEILIHN